MGAEKSFAGGAVDDLETRIDNALARWPEPDRGPNAGDERIARILARVEREGAARSENSPLLNVPLLGEAVSPERRAVARKPWLHAGATVTALAAAAAALLLVGPRNPQTPPERAPLASIRGSVPPTPAASLASADDAIDPSLLPRAPAGDNVAETGRRAGRRATSALDGPARGGPLSDPPVDGESEVPVPVGAGRMSLSSGTPDSVPLRPAMGAVESAVAQVLPAARACLKSGDAVRATITFAPSGRTMGVAVAGMEAGAPVAVCVGEALAGANVGPFASPVFMWTATVRGP